MYKKRMIFWDQNRQRIRFSATNDFKGIENYSFIGFSNEHEFEILLEVLFDRFGDQDITTNQILTIYQNFMKFLDNLKNLTSGI
jgi:hypothetical protein